MWLTIEPNGRLHQLGGALAVSNFRRYVAGQSLSLIGTWVETVAQALLVLQLTHSGLLLGLTTAARYAPILLLSPYAGLLIDRFDKRRVLLVTQVGLGGVSLLSGWSLSSAMVRFCSSVKKRRRGCRGGAGSSLGAAVKAVPGGVLLAPVPATGRAEG
jgi:MFS family permease